MAALRVLGDADGDIDAQEETMSTATIVCAVNETEGAAEALRTATELGRRLGMRLVAVHVVEDAPVSADARREAWSGGVRLVDRVLAEQGAWTADRRVAVGDPAAHIARIAGEERAELVLVGSKRHGRRARPPLQSRVATELPGMTPVPVVVVPPGRRASSPATADRDRDRIGSDREPAGASMRVA